MSSSKILEVANISKSYTNGDEKLRVLDNISFTLKKGEILGILGISGAGKTTLLEIIAGLQEPDSGEVILYSKTNTEQKPLMIFQEYANSLYPFLTAVENVVFALEMSREYSKEEKHNVAIEALATTGLEGFENYYPWQLSGGMKQRLAISRALALKPSVLLLDEPFASLDIQNKSLLEDVLVEVARKFELSIIYVTHDIDSAIYFSNRIICMSKIPSKVVEEFDVDIPGIDGKKIDVKTSSEFNQRKGIIMNFLNQQWGGQND